MTLASGDKQRLETKSIVIATGSDVARLPGIDIDEKTIVSSTGALTLAKVPKRMLVIGAGVIGLELGSVWRRLGSEVLVVEFLDRILPGIDAEVARSLQRILAKQGMSFKLASKVTGVARTATGHKVTVEPAAGDGADGRWWRPTWCWSPSAACPTRRASASKPPASRSTTGSASSSTRTSRPTLPGIYAIGDVIAGPMLAHKAEDEGMAVAEILAGQAGHVNYDVIPNVIYTFPEVATVGKSEEDLKAAGVAYKVGKFPFTANGRAKVNKTTDGFVKILADAEDRPHPRRAHHRRAGERDDRGSRRHHGVRRLGRGPRPHLPRPSDADRGRQGGGAGGRQAHDPHVRLTVPAEAMPRGRAPCLRAALRAAAGRSPAPAAVR